VVAVEATAWGAESHSLGLFHETKGKGYMHIFFGSAPGGPEKLAEEMKKSFPNLGTYFSPFRPPTREEDAEVIETINRADPDVLCRAGVPQAGALDARPSEVS
jgi:UDP-N-acetyl-D-mannosaminuronic acid transferase (WecB/TagA/CpsF family)